MLEVPIAVIIPATISTSRIRHADGMSAAMGVNPWRAGGDVLKRYSRRCASPPIWLAISVKLKAIITSQEIAFQIWIHHHSLSDGECYRQTDQKR